MNDKTIPFFVAAKPESFKWPVRVPVPGDGKYTFIEFTGVFKYLDDDGEAAFLDPARKRTDKQFAAEVLLAVEGLTYEDGTAVASTPELTAQVLAVDRVAAVTVGTYLGARRGLAAEKNS